jgi:hypothetical protein
MADDPFVQNYANPNTGLFTSERSYDAGAAEATTYGSVSPQQSNETSDQHQSRLLGYYNNGGT